MADLQLTPRQQDFLLAAHLASWRTTRVFRASTVCEWIGARGDECAELYRWGEKAGLVSHLPGDEAILTAKGTAAAAALRRP